MRKLAVLLLLICAAFPARADGNWYGWQIVLVDAGTIGLGIAAKSGAIGGAGYLLGGPIVHLAHGDYVEAGVDLGLRAALPLGGAIVGDKISGCTGACDAPGAGFLLGGMAGGAVALIVDYTFLSNHGRPYEARTTAAFTPAAGGGVLTLAGRF
jgi:hypothetical protein